MMPKKQDHDGKSRKRLIESVISLLLTVMVLLFSSLAWFTMQHQLKSTGAQMQVVDQPSLTVARTAGGADIDTLDMQAPENYRYFEQSITDNKEEIAPGDSGQFSVYLTLHGGGQQIHITPEVLPGVVAEDGTVSAIDGYKTKNGFTPQTAQKAVGYLQGHVLLFRHLENGVYSGWMNAVTGTDVPLVSGTETEVTFYWVWVPNYYLLREGSTLIAPEDVTAIQATMRRDIPTASQYLLDSREQTLTADTSLTWLSHFYDFADEDIGRMLSRIYCQLTFT